MNKDELFDLRNKVCIITGGAGLLGREFSEECAKRNAIVVIADVDSVKGEKTAKEIKENTKNNNVFFQNCNIVSQKDIQELIDFLIKKFGKIDVLVNNAYPKNKNYGKRFEKVSYEDFCDNVNLHLGGYFLMAQQISEVMKKQKFGNIINIASIYGFMAPRFEIYKGTGMTMPVEYSLIKSGIINLTKYLASYLGKYNIRVNSISPGGIFTNQPKIFVEKYTNRVVLGKRMANADDLAGTLVYLLSDASKYITGQNIIVDGGWSL